MTRWLASELILLLGFGSGKYVCGDLYTTALLTRYFFGVVIQYGLLIFTIGAVKKCMKNTQRFTNELMITKEPNAQIT